jgi:hypothetical protein
MTGYPDKKPTSPAKVESVAGYQTNKAPAAAEFGKGARNLAEIQQATDARRAHNESLSRGYAGPRGPAIGRDAK